MKAVFHSIRGEKSALCIVRANDFEFSGKPVYLPREAVLKAVGLKSEEMVAGEVYNKTFNLPDGGKLVPIVDGETGEIRTTTNGETLHQLAW